MNSCENQILDLQKLINNNITINNIIFFEIFKKYNEQIINLIINLKLENTFLKNTNKSFSKLLNIDYNKFEKEYEELNKEEIEKYKENYKKTYDEFVQSISSQNVFDNIKKDLINKNIN